MFKRFLPNNEKSPHDEGTVWLVATSAGEVGVNISADHLICDLSTYESMAQRFGRVNRFGERDDSTITVVHPQEFPHAQKIEDAKKAVAQKEKDADKKLQEIMKKEAVDIALEKTLALLNQLDGNASPAALEKLDPDKRAATFSPLPKLRVATEIQFDAWALTSIRKSIAARPPVAIYLHGEAEWEPSETHVAWREEPDIIEGELLAAYPPEDLLEDFPLKPHELLRDTSRRVAEKISALIEKLVQDEETDRHKIPTAWLLREDGTVKPFSLTESDKLSEAYKKKKERSNDDKELIKRHKSDLESRLADATLILPASLGGISAQGLLSEEVSGNGMHQHPIDVADIDGNRLRIRASSPDIPDKYNSDYRLIRAIDTRIGDEDGGVESPTRYWLWLEAKNSVNAEKRSAVQPETIETHTRAIAANVASIAEKLLPPPVNGEPDLRRCLVVAAELHDLGKNRRQWQLGIGNTAYDPTKPGTILAKSGGAMRPRNLADNYRHEFGSLMDAVNSNKFIQFSDDEKDVALHLVAAHHGRARPHFPAEEVFDYGSAPVASAAVATEVPGRFACLQNRFGRWGLAWLESLLRAADYAASAGIVAADSAFSTYFHTLPSEKGDKSILRQEEQKDITLRVDVTNPGQFFACCGLFELASRITPNLHAYFKEDNSAKQWHFIITGIGDRSEPSLTLQSLLEEITKTEITSENSSLNAKDDSEGIDSEGDGDGHENEQTDAEDKYSSPLIFGDPFDIKLDWWKTATEESKALKTWAGSMNVLRIARAMKEAINKDFVGDNHQELFCKTCIVYDPNKMEEAKEKKNKKIEAAGKKKSENLIKANEALESVLENGKNKKTVSTSTMTQEKAQEQFEKSKRKVLETFTKEKMKACEAFEKARSKAKVEPFYFDARRGHNADSRDVGFSPDSLQLKTNAAPAVEFLCLVGLQRAIPASAEKPRQFVYNLWTKPLPISLVAAAINDQVSDASQYPYHFASWFRTSQKKHKAFLPSTLTNKRRKK